MFIEIIVMMILDFLRDMVEEVFFKFFIIVLRGVRFICKNWNIIILNDWSFIKKVY